MGGLVQDHEVKFEIGHDVLHQGGQGEPEISESVRDFKQAAAEGYPEVLLHQFCQTLRYGLNKLRNVAIDFMFT